MKHPTHFPSPPALRTGSRAAAALALGAAPALAGSGLDCGTVVGPGPILFATWTSAGSPYCVDGDLLVTNLTIQPGVRVLVAEDVEIEVLGTLTAVGSAEEPILFSALDRSKPWRGLEFTSMSSASTLRHCRVEFAEDSGARIVGASPTIEDTIFNDNTTLDSGGGLSVSLGTSDLTLRTCVFVNNGARSHGGAIHAAMDGGFALRLEDCIFEDNGANHLNAFTTVRAGAVHFDSPEGDLFVERCLFRDNTAFGQCPSWCCDTRAYGGALYAAGGDVLVRGSAFHGNRAWAEDDQVGGCETNRGYGGAIYFASATHALTVVDSVLTGNSAFTGGTSPLGQGGAVYVATGTAHLDSSTLARNDKEGLYAAAGSATIERSILYWNDADYSGVQVAGGATVSAADSCVEGGLAGPGVIDVDPEFVGPGDAPHDVGLSASSPCIDASATGTDCSVGTSPYGGQGTATADLGAFGGDGACSWQTPVEGSWSETLRATPSYQFAAPGGVQDLRFSFGPAQGGALYLVVGSITGTSPGLPGAVPIPLNYDPYFFYTMVHPNQSPLIDTFGFLDPWGSGASEFSLGASSNPSYPGIEIHHAVVALNAVTGSLQAASNAEPFRLE